MKSPNPLSKNAISSLQDIIDYSNDSIVHKFIEKYDISFDEGAKIFKELRKWLWLSATVKRQRSLGLVEKDFHLTIDKSMVMIDEMWHTFILFTIDYTSFCNNHFGYYIHHAPASKKAKDKRGQAKVKNPEKEFQRIYNRTEKQYELVYDLLGESTLIFWYKTLADKYTPQDLEKLTKPIESVLGLK